MITFIGHRHYHSASSNLFGDSLPQLDTSTNPYSDELENQQLPWLILEVNPDALLTPQRRHSLVMGVATYIDMSFTDVQLTGRSQESMLILGKNKVAAALDYFNSLSKFLSKNDLATLGATHVELLKQFQSRQYTTAAKFTDNFIVTNDRIDSDNGSHQIIEVQEKVPLTSSYRTYIAKRNYAGRKIVEIEVAIATLHHLINPNTPRAEFAIDQTTNRRMYFLSEKIDNLKSFGEFQDINNTMPYNGSDLINMGVAAEIVAAFVLANNDKHKGNWGIGTIKGKRCVVGFDDDRALYPLTAKYIYGKGYNYDDENNCLKMTVVDIIALPSVSHFNASRWVSFTDDENIWCSYIKNIADLANSKEFIIQKFKYFLKCILISGEQIDRIFSYNIFSEKYKKLYIDFTKQRFNDLTKKLFHTTEFCQCIINHPEFKDEIVKEIIEFNNELPRNHAYRVDLSEIEARYNYFIAITKQQKNMQNISDNEYIIDYIIIGDYKNLLKELITRYNRLAGANIASDSTTNLAEKVINLKEELKLLSNLEGFLKAIRINKKDFINEIRKLKQQVEQLNYATRRKLFTAPVDDLLYWLNPKIRLFDNIASQKSHLKSKAEYLKMKDTGNLIREFFADLGSEVLHNSKLWGDIRINGVLSALPIVSRKLNILNLDGFNSINQDIQTIERQLKIELALRKLSSAAMRKALLLEKGIHIYTIGKTKKAASIRNALEELKNKKESCTLSFQKNNTPNNGEHLIELLLNETLMQNTSLANILKTRRYTFRPGMLFCLTKKHAKSSRELGKELGLTAK